MITRGLPLPLLSQTSILLLYKRILLLLITLGFPIDNFVASIVPVTNFSLVIVFSTIKLPGI